MAIQTTDFNMKPSDLSEEVQLLPSVNNNLYQRVMKLTQKMGDLVKENAELREELGTHKAHEKAYSEEAVLRMKASLLGTLTSTQADSLVTGKPVRPWEEDDIGTAIAITSLSSRTYNYFTKTLLLPLPSVPTINRWL